jgi:predicted metal-dependent enzyme (double-stranded beta helix superfamily)
MEIWPIGHYSPIHNHSDANAIIRVLHGQINVSLYPFLCAEKDGVKPFCSANFYKDEITWISPTLNQTHKLLNEDTNTQSCITIQCYMYDNENSIHYDYFDYLDENGKILQYEPDSDMDFISFKNKMKEEWNNRVLK